MLNEKNNMLEEFLNYDLLNVGDYRLSVFMIINIIIVLILTKIILFAIKKAIKRASELHAIQSSNTYALLQIISYIVWTISILIILNIVGLKLNAILTGSAALLVGIGLGLQQTFNDFISGVILLFEGKTRVGDILEIDGDILKLKEIGLRTTEGINRDGISIIVPNSKIITDKVINWTHQEKRIRFKIDVGVAYGSDVELVIELLEKSAQNHPSITNKENIEARFVNFGNSALEFQLLFVSPNVFRAEKVKSDVRRNINKLFIEHNITIPFPQMDVHLKND